MAVDRAQLQQFIDELPFTKAEDKAYLTNALLADEAAATQFVAQRLRHSDYTKKTTDLSTKEKDLAARANQSVQQYATQLQEAQNQQRKIMDDLSNERISRTRAETLLQKVKTVYQLSDDDIPKIDPVTEQPKPGQGGMLDRATVEQMLQAHEQNLLKKLGPELEVFPQLNSLMSEIDSRHSELTGKRLTHKERMELIQQTKSDNHQGGIMGAWREKYGIDAIEKTKEREQWDKENRQKWEDEQRAAASDAALRQVTRGSDGKFTSLSPVMGRKYNEHVDSTNKAEVDARAAQQNAQQSGPKLSGAERAAAKYIERRNAGIPLGQEGPVGQNQK